MALADFFFSYTLYVNNRILRIGKGGVSMKSKEAVESYLRAAYPRKSWRWTHFSFEFHVNEGAAFKAERRGTDDYERATGSLPPWNAMRGGSGGRAFDSCKADLASGERCLSLALAGNYFCGVHRRA